MEKSETRQLRNHFAAITGASSGIGLGLAKVFAENGYDILIAAEEEYIKPPKI
jgi:short-subunit dehydrogenase